MSGRDKVIWEENQGFNKDIDGMGQVSQLKWVKLISFNETNSNHLEGHTGSFGILISIGYISGPILDMWG